MERYGTIAQRNKDGSFGKAKDLYVHQKKQPKDSAAQMDLAAVKLFARVVVAYMTIDQQKQ